MAGGVVRVNTNGILFNYDPPGGIDTISCIQFDPTAVPYQTGLRVAMPQGDSGGILTTSTPGVPFDGIWDGREVLSAPLPSDGIGQVVVPRQSDAGFGSTVKSSSGNRYFTTNVRARAVSGLVEPTAGPQDDGSIHWNGSLTLRTWVASTAYSLGQVVIKSGYMGLDWVWRCVTPGVSGLVEPVWAPVLPGTVTIGDGDGDLVWRRVGISRGNWAATTEYGCQVDPTTLTNLYIEYVTLAGTPTIVLPWGYSLDGAFTDTTSEPAWSAAPTNSLWLDGPILWVGGSLLYPGNPLVNGSEQLVLTGIKAPAQDGRLLRIENVGPAGTNMQVVLADYTSITSAASWPSVKSPTDADSDPCNSFFFPVGGFLRSVYIRTETYVLLRYNAAACRWLWANSGAVAPQNAHLGGRGGGW